MSTYTIFYLVAPVLASIMEAFSMFVNIMSKERYKVPQVYFRRRAEIWRPKNISARFGLAWHATVLDEENIAVLKLY